MADLATDIVQYYNFNLPTIPSDATINGIEVSVEGYQTGGATPRQADISLSWDGGSSYTTGAGTGIKTTNMPGNNPASEAVRTFGGAADTWGRTWAPGDFVNANFRVRLDTNLATSGRYLYIDHVQARVTYTPAPLVISTTSPLTSGTVGVAYSQTLAATGGIPSYTWSIDSGSLPAGLSLNPSTGAITGTPTAAGGPTSITFRVTDSVSVTTTKALSITVNKGNQTITVTAHAPASATYGNTFTVIATGGGSGNPVVITADGSVCTGGGNDSTLITMASGTGTGHVYFNQAGNANYNAATQVQEDVTAQKASLTITADNRSKTYGDTVTFAGTEFTHSAMVGSDDVSSVTLTSAGSAAGATVAGSPYAIVPSAAVGTGLGNYTITYANGSLTVNKANATIKVTPYSVTYDGDPHTATGTRYRRPGRVPGSASTSSGTTHTNAGTYNGDPWTFTDVTGNYNDDSGTVNDSIAKADATINVTRLQRHLRRRPAHGATGTATGVKGEDLTGLDLSGTTLTDAGTYTATPGPSPMSPATTTTTAARVGDQHRQGRRHHQRHRLQRHLRRRPARRHRHRHRRQGRGPERLLDLSGTLHRRARRTR